MRKLHLFVILAVGLLVGCSGKSGFELEIPEVAQADVLIIHADPEQIEAGLQDTLAVGELTQGKYSITFDSLSAKSERLDCTLMVRSKDGKLALTLPLPLEEKATTSLRVSSVSDFLAGKSYVRASYGGNDYAEAFSDFFNKLFTEYERLSLNPEEATQIYQKQVSLYKSMFEQYPDCGLAYSLLIGQIIQGDVRETTPLTEYCSELCLEVDYSNLWANYLCNVMKDRQKKAVSSSVLSFTALDINEKVFTERDIKPHKYVLVCFWASWCKPCREELPLLQQLYKDYNKKGLEIVNISIDTNPAQWYEFAKQNPLPWLSLIGDGREFSTRYDFETIPMNIIVDSAGRVIKRELYGEDIRKAVSELLDK